MSAAGFVDRVELHGETYEVQTELVDPTGGRIRTVIFHSGQAVAVNETCMRSAAALAHDPESVREVVALHHRHVIDGFVGRTRTFAERLRSGQPPVVPHPAPVPAPTGAEVSPEAEMPPFPEDPAVSDGFDLRRLFGELRRRIEHRSAAPDEPALEAGPTGDRGSDLCARLDRARHGLAWAIGQPQFTRARVDEQVRFHLLKEKIEAWADHGRNPDEAEWIWTEIVTFCDYVSEVNHRAELVDFDRRLVQWGLRALDRHGPSRATLKPLEWLFGRDRDLDEVLATGATPPAAVWTLHLRRIWRRLGMG